MLKYLYTNDESGDGDASPSSVSDRIELDDVCDEFKSSICLNINNCISDDAESHTSVINKYLENENDPLTKNELEEFARQRRLDLKMSQSQKLLILAAYITEPDYE